MALHLQLPTPSTSSSSSSTFRNRARRSPNFNSHVNLRIKCSIPVKYDPLVPRRSEAYQYQPTIWDYDFVESLKSNFAGDTYMNQMEKRKKDIRLMLEKAATPIAQLELIDTIQRLGIGYLFEEEIKRVLQKIYDEKDYEKNLMKDSLHATSLSFRLLRQYGFQVSQDVFSNYKHAKGEFLESIPKDVKGMLSLYEAAHLVCGEEKILEDARIFTTKHLKEVIKEKKIEPKLANEISRSLEIPLHWRMQRAEARWFMDAYESNKDSNSLLLELAKLNFNMVQATHQKDLRNMSRWWRNLGVAPKLNFARDRLVESFLWSMGISVEPQYARCREWLTKVMNFVLIIDDIFDVYGSLDELELFTEVVERWDTKAMDKLPYCMKILGITRASGTVDCIKHFIRHKIVGYSL